MEQSGGMCVRNLNILSVFFIANIEIVFGQSVRIHLYVKGTSVFADSQTNSLLLLHRLLLLPIRFIINSMLPITSCSKY